ncbi:hypothetical protein [Streptomyces sp. AA0539]|uniref:hypothetical protein n=1 Tax=Streptomyces sp. AA0539 TaxID=1210045 RepID=UPI00131A02F6|nr:hypothetical protein [Streptomyces sp. AA0539]
MTLDAEEYELLRLIAQSPEPVAASDFFHTIHPANGEQPDTWWRPPRPTTLP